MGDHPGQRMPYFSVEKIARALDAHPDLDVERVVRESALVLDFRGVTRGIEAPNLVRL